MPNYCENRLIISHSDENMINRIIKALNKGKLLEEFIPTPEDLVNNDNWYSWRINNWGTKWDISNINFTTLSAHKLDIDFFTPWCPPLKAYQKFQELSFEVEAWYNESGVGFCGIFKNNVDMSFNYEDRDKIPKELDEYFKIFNVSDDEDFSDDEDDEDVEEN